MELTIKDLFVNAFDKEILKGVNLKIAIGEIHVIMGANGAGKSTLASCIMGDDKFAVKGGDILIDDKSILKDTVDMRARKGVFLAMQYPEEVFGVTNFNFIKTAVNVLNKDIKLVEFIEQLDYAVDFLQMKKDLPHRYLNVGFSGGEKKRNEILQMIMLNPKFAMLDEIDSGLDMDAFKIACEAIEKQRQLGTGFLIITHYQKLLDFLKPDYVHIMKDGKIIKTGNIELVSQIEKDGYDSF